ncbi:MAG: hypothetical protein EHM46_06200, partial [Bacteroidetes bacterium]
MSEYHSKEYARRIGELLRYLKNNKIQQWEVGERLNYTSLSKAKNYENYPQNIIEKLNRKELYELILEEYGLLYEEKTGEIRPAGSSIVTTREKEDQYFIMYYYAFARDTVARAIVRIINNRHAVIDYRFDEHWEGTYEIIENYTFIYVEKRGEVTPVKKLICLFSGTKKSGRPYLLGTYSTVKRDGIPAAGKIFFERVGSDEIEMKIKSNVDPRIGYYLMNKVWVTETFTPNTLDDITGTYRLIRRFTSDYYLFYPKANSELEKAHLCCDADSRAVLSIKGMTYTGFIKPADSHSVRIEVNSIPGFSEKFTDTIILFVNLSKSKYDPFYLCVGI